MSAPACRHCGELESVCGVEVDAHTFPPAAVKAYASAGLATALRCDGGQRMDLIRTGGWCLDRIVRHSQYRGDAIEGLKGQVDPWA